MQQEYQREREEGEKNLCNGASLSVLDLTFAFTLGSVQFILSENDISYWRIFRLFANISEPDLKIKVKAERFVVDSEHLCIDILAPKSSNPI